MPAHGDEVNLGGPPRSVRLVDPRRDPRFARHSTRPAQSWSGDAQIAGVAVEETDPRRRALVLQAADHLVVEIYQPGVGVRRVVRR